jgi:hypothetical protein
LQQNRHRTDMLPLLSDVRCWSNSGKHVLFQSISPFDPMYGPAVRCKWILPSWRLAVLHQCIRPLIGVFCAPGHHGYQRACDLIMRQTSMGQLGHQFSHAPGRPILHLFSSSRRPRRVRVFKLATSSRVPHFSASVAV